MFSHMFMVNSFNFKEHWTVITTYCSFWFDSMNSGFVSLQNEIVTNILPAYIALDPGMNISLVVLQRGKFSKTSITLITFIWSIAFMFGSYMFRQDSPV